MDYWFKAVTLISKNIQLNPLSTAHLEDLKQTVVDGLLFNHWYTTIPQPKGVDDEIK